jgi:hypothetical protein
MKKLNLCISVIAAFVGAGSAYASTAPKKPSAVHDWINSAGETKLRNMTTAQAQTTCAGTFGICLRAKDNVNVTTVGTFTL